MANGKNREINELEHVSYNTAPGAHFPPARRDYRMEKMAGCHCALCRELRYSVLW
jgi:hypothetical protein